MNFTTKGGNFSIDGRSFSGKSVIINGNTLIIDGVTQEGSLVGDINITITGNVQTLSNERGSVSCKNVGSVSTMSGDVICGDISGDVDTMSGDVDCGNIGGNVSTMSGDITKHEYE